MQKQSTLSNKVAISIVSTIFFMWGFLTCLNDILIPHLKSLFNLNYTESALIQFTFFGAYFIVSIPAGKIVSKIGYKNSISLGLLIAAIGALLFYPAAEFAYYPFFLAALFILASGITILQVAANPYVSLLGPQETASSRLNFAQALNSLGTTLAPQFGSMLILSASVIGANQLAQLNAAAQTAYKAQQAAAVQGPYLFLALILVLLAIAIFLFRLPNFPGDTSSREQAHNTSFTDVLKFKHVFKGVIALFLYVGAEVSIGSFLINFISLPEIGNVSESTAASYMPIYWGGAMVGRFIGAVLLRKFDPGKLLGFAGIAATILLVLTILTNGPFAVWAVVSIGLFNSIMFPTIFSLGIRGLGTKTEKASSLLIMAIVGGAIIPMLHGVLADNLGLHLAFVLPAFCYLYITYYGFKGSKVSQG